MAILKIARMGHPVLRRPADSVEDPNSPEISRLINDMIETLADAGGAGLAAPQVHVPLRLVIFHVPKSRLIAEGEEKAGPEGLDKAQDSVPLTVLINPEIEILTQERVEGLEGCLSVPGLAGLVPRFSHIRYRGLGPGGAPIEREARGFHARVVQHECDHLDGILYPQRMADLGRLGFVEELRRHRDALFDDADEEV